jgi:hypothetical protein
MKPSDENGTARLEIECSLGKCRKEANFPKEKEEAVVP